MALIASTSSITSVTWRRTGASRGNETVGLSTNGNSNAVTTAGRSSRLSIRMVRG